MVTAFPTDSLRQGNEMPVSAKGLKMLIYMPMVGKTIRHGKLKQKSKKKKNRVSGIYSKNMHCIMYISFAVSLSMI